jgi:type IV pilus assembly protein PilA
MPSTQHIDNENTADVKGGDKGFTLIELMVVVLVIAILLAIAIPTFTGARTRAQASVAQTSLTNAAKAAQIVAVDRAGSFTGTTNAELSTAEPSLTWENATPAGTTAATASDGAKNISWLVVGSDLVGAALGADNQCYYVQVASTGTIQYGKDAATAAANDCGADETLPTMSSDIATGW